MESENMNECNKEKRDNYTIENKKFRGEPYYNYFYNASFTAGDVVQMLLKKKLDVKVYWEDDGDVSMKNGGSCLGQEFSYPAMVNPWGGCFYEIQFMYQNQEYSVTTFQKEDNSSSNHFSVSVTDGIVDRELFPKLMDWES